MGLNNTPTSERIHIGFFGKRNAGKSSVVNALTNQKISVVSDIKGTTTDPVYKSMELLPLGPVMIIDTPGLDDEGALGALRIEKTKEVLRKTDIAVIVVDSEIGETESEKELIDTFSEKNIPYIVVYNKYDVTKKEINDNNRISVSASSGYNINELKNRIAKLTPSNDTEKTIVGEFLQEGDIAVLVVPIDSAAPKGRLILPQQQTIRDILDHGAISVVVRDSELEGALKHLSQKPKLVITDSQAFARVSKIVPEDISLTSFSILFARYKGDLQRVVNAARQIDNLKDGDTILISEGCTHHRQCDDIGTVKLPRWLREYTGKNINIRTSSGMGFPEDLSGFKLVIHCGGCMLNEREMQSRIKMCAEQNIPITNYGTAIAYMKGILERSIKIFPELK